ncbi:hypothetical protein llap_16388 [Limosa lapponica baueri]|uniref:Uncharacterized protein n=1 Tax=Limosa lapponica baueri TaxID=1758121 RepID=A0A2I0THL5_LIMLA|nr:hypothetical protein llap_16388 [Limosa lapponica baueri]
MLKRQPWEPYSELLLKPDGESKAGKVGPPPPTILQTECDSPLNEEVCSKATGSSETVDRAAVSPPDLEHFSSNMAQPRKYLWSCSNPSLVTSRHHW